MKIDSPLAPVMPFLVHLSRWCLAAYQSCWINVFTSLVPRLSLDDTEHLISSFYRQSDVSFLDVKQSSNNFPALADRGAQFVVPGARAAPHVHVSPSVL